MAESDRVINLSKYIMTLPKSKTSVFIIIVISFLTGAIIECLMPGLDFEDGVYAFLSGGTNTFFLFGLTTIASGAFVHSIINSFKQRHMKLKQALFLSLVSMFFTCAIFFIGSIVSLTFNVDLRLNSMLLGLLIGFAIETLILWSTSNIKFRYALSTGIIHPLITLSMYVLILSLTDVVTSNVILSLYLKAIIGAIILAIAVYSFGAIVESPIRANLGVGGLELLSLFIAQITEGSTAMEEAFSTMGEPIDTMVSLISFKNKEGIKANYISPCVHPGPVGSIGGGNLPTVLAEELEDFTIVPHGAATHDFNPVAAKEISKITNTVNNVLENLEYSTKASKFQRVQYGDAKIGVQFFDKGLILLSTFAPEIGDDIDYGVGLSMMYEAKYVTGVEDVVLVDCHNSLKGNYDRLMAGHHRVVEIEEAIKKIEKPEMYPIKMGCAYDSIDDVDIKEGIGQSGLKIMITEVDNQKMLYAVFDGNNMLQGFRERIFKEVQEKYPEIDYIEVMTTDTHMVNTMSGGGITVGTKKGDLIIKHLLDLIPEALNDLEEVNVASGSGRVNINSLGPNNSTELVTTISSIVSVSKILAPLVFIVSIIIIIMWIL